MHGAVLKPAGSNTGKQGNQINQGAAASARAALARRRELVNTGPFCANVGGDEVPEFAKNLLKKMVNSNDELANLSSELCVKISQASCPARVLALHRFW